jgi:hypothetical protein
MSEENHTGGCLCGAVRYEIRARFLQTTLCHCEDCRKASGAPFVAWSFFPSGSLVWTRGTPRTLKHAERERSFCGDCGSPLTFFDPSIPSLFEANTNTLDDPARYPPVDQCWVCDELPWSAMCMDLPRHDLASPLP